MFPYWIWIWWAARVRKLLTFSLKLSKRTRGAKCNAMIKQKNICHIIHNHYYITCTAVCLWLHHGQPILNSFPFMCIIFDFFGFILKSNGTLNINVANTNTVSHTQEWNFIIRIEHIQSIWIWRWRIRHERSYHQSVPRPTPGRQCQSGLYNSIFAGRQCKFLLVMVTSTSAAGYTTQPGEPGMQSAGVIAWRVTYHRFHV